MAATGGRETGESAREMRSSSEAKRPGRNRTSNRSKNRAEEGRGGGEISVCERHELIAGAAYSRSEARGFPAGCEQGDWLAAEKEVDGRTA